MNEESHSEAVQPRIWKGLGIALGPQDLLRLFGWQVDVRVSIKIVRDTLVIECLSTDEFAVGDYLASHVESLGTELPWVRLPDALGIPGWSSPLKPRIVEPENIPALAADMHERRKARGSQ